MVSPDIIDARAIFKGDGLKIFVANPIERLNAKAKKLNVSSCAFLINTSFLKIAKIINPIPNNQIKS